MCGIAGEALAGEGNADLTGVRALAERLRHRGPDHVGTWLSPDGRCALGHARLSILDLSAAGNQPMVDPHTGSAIVLNGEIYNFRELRAGCEARGDVFRSGTDTEVVLALYRRFGRACVDHLRGMFAFGLWDATRRELFLARDRLGKKPLHYALEGGRLWFASEIDPLVRVAGVPGDTDPAALELFLQLQYVPAPWTIYRAIRKLPPAHCAVLGEDGLAIWRYWEPAPAGKRRVREAEALDELEERLREAVRLRLLASDVPVGALLSGGVDSSLVVAMMARELGAPVHTFSVGFEDASFSELPHAARVAALLGTDHHPEVVSPDVAALLERVVRHHGEPFADSSAIPSFRVAESARRHVKVVMTGDGGDELLGGYPRYTLRGAAVSAGRLLSGSPRGSELGRLMASLAPGAAPLRSRVRRRWTLRAAHPELQSLFVYSTFWNDEERAELMGGSGSSDLLPRWRAEWLDAARRAADHPVDRMLWMDARTYLPGDLLVKMDVATMACGLEARAPLLDHELVEYCAVLPVGLKVRRGTGKYLLKRLAERYLPRDLIHRPKQGFAIPKERWLRGELRPLLDSVVLDGDDLAPLDGRVARRTLRAFHAGDGSHRDRLWALLMYGMWRRVCGAATPG
jgi:asparagine synthase (glutamine-hydrolysing)